MASRKVWRINRSANRLLIVTINLDGFSLVNLDNLSNLLPPNFSTICVRYVEHPFIHTQIHECVHACVIVSV